MGVRYTAYHLTVPSTAPVLRGDTWGFLMVLNPRPQALEESGWETRSSNLWARFCALTFSWRKGLTSLYSGPLVTVDGFCAFTRTEPPAPGGHWAVEMWLMPQKEIFTVI